MTLKGCKSIAEYVIRRWMGEQGFADGYFSLKMNGYEAEITDGNGDMLILVYDGGEKCVYIKE